MGSTDEELENCLEAIEYHLDRIDKGEMLPFPLDGFTDDVQALIAKARADYEAYNH